MTRPRPALEARGDAAADAQAAAVAHLEACEAALVGETEAVGSPAVTAYCGCTTCEVVETLAAVWPVIVADCAALIEEALPVHVNAGASAAAKLLRAEAARVALPHTPHSEGVHA